MSYYIAVKLIHVFTVILAITGFFLRGILMIRGSNLLQKPLVKIIPHVNDTILLVSAIALTMITSQRPISTAWINAKIFALFAYIALGLIAFRFGTRKSTKVVAWLMALIVFSYIVMVAISKNAILIH